MSLSVVDLAERINELVTEPSLAKRIALGQRLRLDVALEISPFEAAGRGPVGEIIVRTIRKASADFHACMTGDCPHDKEQQCVEEMLTLAAEALAQEKLTDTGGKAR